MLLACWSAKGGSGTTTVAVALAALAARRSGAGAVVVDCCGDIPAALGLPEPSGPGLADWLAAGPDVPPGALGALEIDAGGGLRLLPAKGAASAGTASAADALVGLLAADPRPVVADCGLAPPGVPAALAAGAAVSWAVLQPCYLALRRALAAPLRPSGVVLVADEGRALGPSDVAEVLGVPVVARVAVDPAVARAVDAGVLGRRPPRGLVRSLGPLVDPFVGSPSPGGAER